MIIVDTNVLLAAFRAELPEHPQAYRWLTDTLAEGVDLVVPHTVQISFVRLATRSLGPLPAAPMATTIEFLRALDLGEDRHPPRLREIALALCQRYGLSGDGTVDAWIAGQALAMNAALASFDRGFAKYRPALRWIDPRDPGQARG